MRGRPAAWPANKLRVAVARGYFRTADLFAGCGGMSLGFHRAGFRSVLAVEDNGDARRSHELNFAKHAPSGDYAAHGDITALRSFDAVRHLARTNKEATDVIDVIIGGPPCQAFSRLGRAALWDIAGKKHAHADDPRATLYEHFLSYVEDLKPLAFVLENVPEIGSFSGKNVAEEIAAASEDLGYKTRYTLLNAAWYGVPQFRDRVFIIGVRRELGFVPSFPPRTHAVDVPSGYATSRAGQAGRPSKKYLLDPHPRFIDHCTNVRRRLPAVTVRQAFRDLAEIQEHLRKPKILRNVEAVVSYRGRPCGYSKQMRSWPGYASNGGASAHVIRLTPRDYPIFQRMKADDNYPAAFLIAENLFARELASAEAELGRKLRRGSLGWQWLRESMVPPYPADKFPDKYHKLNADSLSGTVPAHLGKDCYSHIHPDSRQARAISIREAARLQSFPDGFAFHGGIGAQFTQIGNAVPPLLALAVAENLWSQLLLAAREANRRRRAKNAKPG